jgi:WD40 repeat protein
MELVGHSQEVCCTIQLSDGRLCTASKDKTIKLWNLSSGECETTLVGHENWVTAIVQYSPTQLCSGSYDETIRLWDIATRVCEKSLKLDGVVEALELLPNGQIACLSLCGLLYFWNVDTDYLCHTVVIDKIYNIKNINDLHMIQLATGDLCISVNKDDNGEIIIFDFKTHQKIKTIPIRHTNYYVNIKTMLLLRDGRLAVGIYSEDDEDVNNEYDTILIYNIDTGECEQELRDTKADHMVQLSDGRLCSCGELYFSVW